MSGWRLGWVILPEHLIDTVNSLQQNMFINAPTISQVAALKCWDDDTQEVLQEHVKKYSESRAIILEALEKTPELTVAPADGGFYIYCDVQNHHAPGYGTVSMCQEFLETCHVAFTPGIDFEDPASGLGERRFRISYAGGIATSRSAMERFQVFWPKWLLRVESANYR